MLQHILAIRNDSIYIECVFESVIEFNQAAFKHGISEADIHHAIKHFVFEEQIDDGDNKHLLLGFDTSRRLLEILYNVVDEQTVNVFHAMKCRKVWRSLVDV
jgi:hypothetical protein